MYVRVTSNSLDHAGRFTLSNEGRSSCDDSFGTTDIEGLQEEPSELGNYPLKDIVVVHHFGEGDEEDDGSESIGEEPEFLINNVRSAGLFELEYGSISYLEDSFAVEEESRAIVRLL